IAAVVPAKAGTDNPASGILVPPVRGRRRRERSRTALKIIRDKTAFHYDRLNLTEAADNLAAGENSLYLAQHPANSLYYMGLRSRVSRHLRHDRGQGGWSWIRHGTSPAM